MVLPKTGLNEKSVDNMIFDAAVVVTDFKYDKEAKEFIGSPLGATNGGAEVTTELSYRKIEADGTYIMDVKNLVVLESGVASVKFTLMELTAENLRKTINGTITNVKDDEAPEGYQVIKPKRYLDDLDYIESVAIIGFLKGSAKPVIFSLDNGLIKTGATIKTEDNKEATVEVEIVAHASLEQLQKDEFPWRIYHPNGLPSEGGTN